MKTLKTILREMAGEISAVFMSQEVKGTEIVMPSEELLKITEKTSSQIKELLEGLVVNEHNINPDGFNNIYISYSELQERIKKILE